MFIKILCIIGWLCVSPIISVFVSAFITSKFLKWKDGDYGTGASCTLMILVTLFTFGIGTILISLIF